MRLSPLALLLMAGVSVMWGTGVAFGGKGIFNNGELTIDNPYHEFGTVTEGDVVKHTFSFKNTGKTWLAIDKAEASCGCTTAKGVFRTYAPGEAGTVEVIIDTKGKHGAIVKTVTLFMRNAAQEKVDLTLTADLVAPPHPVVDKGVIITKEEKCKSCHLDSGVGQEGVFLYHRVCAQCHGKKGKGASARAFNESAWQVGIGDEKIRELIKKDHLPSEWVESS